MDVENRYWSQWALCLEEELLLGPTVLIVDLEVNVDKVVGQAKVCLEELRRAQAAYDSVIEKAKATGQLSPQAKQDRIHEATEHTLAIIPIIGA